MEFFTGEDGLESVYAWAIPFHATVILAEMIYSLCFRGQTLQRKRCGHQHLSGADELRAGPYHEGLCDGRHVLFL